MIPDSAEFAAGMFAASLPPLKSFFEGILTKVFKVHSGLTTPSATRRKGHSYGNSQTLRSSRRPQPGSAMGTGFEFDDDDVPHGAATVYAMGDMNTKKKWRTKGEDEISEEDDQKHILHQANSVKTGSDGHDPENGQGDGWITKTIEYTVSDAQSIGHSDVGPGARRR
jgi:hypothetical protein